MGGERRFKVAHVDADVGARSIIDKYVNRVKPPAAFGALAF